jgi:ribosomal protein S1
MPSKTSRKKPKIDLWEITGCVHIQEIETKGVHGFVEIFKVGAGTNQYET